MEQGSSPVRQSRQLGWPLVVALALVSVAGCIVDVNLGDARLVCSDGRCPGGFECIEARCIPEGQGEVNDASAEESDAAPIDAAPPADAPPADGPVLLTCDEQYGGAPAYELCIEEPGSCEFFLNADPAPAASCDDHCLDVGGGDCIDAFDADPAAPCVRAEQTGCQEALDLSKICICSRLPAR
jgi:hypothetical protein